MGNDIEAAGSEKDLDYTVREIPASQEQDEKRDAVFGEITDKGPNYRAVRLNNSSTPFDRERD